MILHHKELVGLIRELNNNKVAFLAIEGVAVNYYGYHRHTGDLDFWIENSTENLDRLILALEKAGFDVSDLVPEKQLSKAITLQTEYPVTFLPVMALSKSFQMAFDDSHRYEFENTWLHFIDIDDLIENKLRSGRPKDLADVDELQKINKAQKRDSD
jgi:hypothetical protein